MGRVGASTEAGKGFGAIESHSVFLELAVLFVSGLALL